MAAQVDQAAQETVPAAAPVTVDAPTKLDAQEEPKPVEEKPAEKDALVPAATTETVPAPATAEPIANGDMKTKVAKAPEAVNGTSTETEPKVDAPAVEAPSTTAAPEREKEQEQEQDKKAENDAPKEDVAMTDAPAEKTDAALAPKPIPASFVALRALNGGASKDEDAKSATSTAAVVDEPLAPTAEKRKAMESLDTNGEVVEKKAKTDDSTEPATNGHADAAPKKAGRPKKEKKAAPAAPAGRTLRKTRSQGPVDA